MGYWLLMTYGLLWYANPRPPRWWTKKCMGFRGLWVIKVMGYEGVNCMTKVRIRFLLRLTGDC